MKASYDGSEDAAAGKMRAAGRPESPDVSSAATSMRHQSPQPTPGLPTRIENMRLHDKATARIMTGGFNKQVFSTFTGRATPTEDTKSKKITAAVDAYESDFGRLKIVPNRFQRARDVLVLQMDMWAVAYLNGRRMVSIPLAKTGDSDRRQMLSEYALVSRNEKASGGVFDLTTA